MIKAAKAVVVNFCLLPLASCLLPLASCLGRSARYINLNWCQVIEL
ncbi:MAG: hypothetical protein F6K26_37220 [Moorea sp. SIO2I5]|nr:hypothetical protein [Moorena sp. SIO2I5]